MPDLNREIIPHTPSLGKQLVKIEKKKAIAERAVLSGVYCVLQQRKLTHWTGRKMGLLSSFVGKYVWFIAWLFTYRQRSLRRINGM